MCSNYRYNWFQEWYCVLELFMIGSYINAFNIYMHINREFDHFISIASGIALISLFGEKMAQILLSLFCCCIFFKVLFFCGLNFGMWYTNVMFALHAVRRQLFLRFGHIIQFALHAPNAEAAAQLLLRWPRIAGRLMAARWIDAAAAAATAAAARRTVESDFIVVIRPAAHLVAIGTVTTAERFDERWFVWRYHLVEKIDVTVKKERENYYVI